MSRILLVTTIFPPDIGGPATFIDLLARKLAGSGYQVTVVCASDNVNEVTDSARPFRVRRVHRLNRALFEVRVRCVLAVEMMRHSHILVNGLDLPVYQVASRMGRRYVMKVVGDTVWESARNDGSTTLDIDQFQALQAPPPRVRRLRQQRGHVLDQARLILTPSQYLRQLITGWGVQRDKVTIVANGVEVSSTKPPRRGGDPFRAVFIGRLTNWKGVETLLLAACKLADCRVTVIGDGPELPHLTSLCRQLELTNVEFAGRLAPAKVQAELSRSHALVLTSLYEGLSHTLLEACAAGVPCIASDRGGNPEVIESGMNGLLVPAEDVAALRDALRELQADEARRFRLGCSAQETARKFSFQSTVDQTCAALSSLPG